MRLKLHHVPYISRRITRDMIHCEFVEIRRDKDSITHEIERIIDEDIENEFKLDEKVSEVLDDQESEIEYLNADYGQLFWMAKKRMANEFGVILNNEDRFNHIAHNILDYLWEEDFIHYTCSDNQVKNVISASIEEFMGGFDVAENEVQKKIKNYKRKLIPGTEDYDLVYKRLYEEELIKRGLM